MYNINRKREIENRKNEVKEMKKIAIVNNKGGVGKTTMGI